MTNTKEEILAKNCGHRRLNSTDRIKAEWAANAMQEYSNQENARLKAVVSKQDALIVYLKAVTISGVPNKEEEDRLLSELTKLKSE